MTQEEMKQEFNALYNMMASSNKVENMHIFGEVHKKMFDWFVANKPDLAMEFLEELESIHWQQYVTAKEAQKILDGMNPKAPWSKDAWKNAMTQLEIPMEEEPYYNSCALWVEMNKMYSDFGDEIAALLGKPLNPTDTDIIKACYKMALKTLKDRDHVYSIRKYFNL